MLDRKWGVRLKFLQVNKQRYCQDPQIFKIDSKPLSTVGCQFDVPCLFRITKRSSITGSGKLPQKEEGNNMPPWNLLTDWLLYPFCIVVFGGIKDKPLHYMLIMDSQGVSYCNVLI